MRTIDGWSHEGEEGVWAIGRRFCPGWAAILALMIHGMSRLAAADPLPPVSTPPSSAALPIAAVQGATSAVVEKTSAGPAAAAEPTKIADNSVTISQAEIQAKIKRIEDDKDIGEELKKKLVEQYQQVAESAKLAERWSQSAAKFARESADAPARAEQNRQQLASATDQIPLVDANLSIDKLVKLVSDTDIALKDARSKVATLENEPKRRADRKLELAKLQALAKQRIEQTKKDLSAPSIEREPAELVEARQLFLKTRKLALEREIESHQAEIRAYEDTASLIGVERDLTLRRAQRLAKSKTAAAQLLNQRRQNEADAQAREAERVRRDLALDHPALAPIAEENERLARERSGHDQVLGVVGKIKKTNEKEQQLVKRLGEVKSEFASVKKKVETFGLTDALGVLLQKDRGRLPTIKVLERNMYLRQREISAVQFQLVELEDKRTGLADIDTSSLEIATNFGLSTDTDADLLERIKKLLSAQRDAIDALIKDNNVYFDALIETDDKERQLLAATIAFNDFIAENALWVGSTPVIHVMDLQKAAIEIESLFNLKNFERLGLAYWADMGERPALWIAAGTGFLALLVAQRWLRRRLRNVGELVSKDYTETTHRTFEAVGLTALISMLWPALLWFLAWRLSSAPLSAGRAKVFGDGLFAVSCVLLILEMIRHACRDRGLAEAHFRWRSKSVRVVRKHLHWLAAVQMPLLFIITMTEAPTVDRGDCLGRSAFLLGLSCLSLFLWRILRRDGGLCDEKMLGPPEAWPARLYWVWAPAAITWPIVMGIVAASGYYYTALQLQRRVEATIYILMAILLVNALMVRWLFAARGKLALKRAQQKKEQAETDDEEVAAVVIEPTDGKSPMLDLSTINAHTRAMLRSTVVFAMLAGVWYTWVDVLPALGVLRKVELWQTVARVAETVQLPDGGVGQQWIEKNVPITLADMINASIILAMTIIASQNLPGLLEITLLERLPFDAGGRYAVTTICRYLATTIGASIALMALGVGWANVQWMAAAVSVGLGFGLQEIFANFVSGVILLFERPMRVGDTVTVGEHTGTVARIRIRATTIVDWDRKEVVIPNREFITGKLINWTLSDRTARVVINLGVAYGSDTDRARRLLIKVAKDHPDVLKDPPPAATFNGFGESSLDFVLRAFVGDVDNLMRVRHELHTAIDRAFRAANIDIAFPQRDINLRLDPSSIAALRGPVNNPDTAQQTA